MNPVKPPPIGVMPQYLWDESHPEPSLADLTARLSAVSAAIQRYRETEVYPIPVAWFYEQIVRERQIDERKQDPGRKCSQCDGEGIYSLPGEPFAKCPQCCGTGRIKDADVPLIVQTHELGGEGG